MKQAILIEREKEYIYIWIWKLVVHNDVWLVFWLLLLDIYSHVHREIITSFKVEKTESEKNYKQIIFLCSLFAIIIIFFFMKFKRYSEIKRSLFCFRLIYIKKIEEVEKKYQTQIFVCCYYFYKLTLCIKFSEHSLFKNDWPHNVIFILLLSI